MRRILRWFVHFVGVVCLMLGLVFLVAWPVSYWWGLGYAHQKLVIDPPARSGAQAISHWDWLSIGVYHGRIFFELENSTDYVDPSRKAGQGFSEFFIERLEQNSKSWGWFRFVDGSGGSFQTLYSSDPTVPAGSVYLRVHPGIPGVMLLLLGILSLVPVLLRRRRLHHRRQSGLCLHCGYNLQGVVGDHCPECGHPRPMVTVEGDAD